MRERERESETETETDTLQTITTLKKSTKYVLQVGTVWFIFTPNSIRETVCVLKRIKCQSLVGGSFAR